MSLLLAPGFGSGGAEPWTAALRGAPVTLHLVPSDPLIAAEPLDLHRWITDADDADRSALGFLAGPLLDVGSGPGRMIRAAVEAGIEAYGVDVNDAAVEATRAAGLPILDGSVFDPLPNEGAWASLLLLDGNIGIGGDARALLARCAELLRRGGMLVAEVDADPLRDEVTECRVRDSDGGESDPFPWSRVGLAALLSAAHDFDLDQVWERNGRWFVRLRAR